MHQFVAHAGDSLPLHVRMRCGQFNREVLHRFAKDLDIPNDGILCLFVRMELRTARRARRVLSAACKRVLDRLSLLRGTHVG